MKFLRMALSAALLTLSANANAMLIELRADYDNGSYIEFSAVVPDSYVFSDGLNLGTARVRVGSPAITYDSLSLTAYWAPDNLTHTTSDGSELSLYEDPLDADNIFDGTGSDGFEYRFSYDLSRYIFDGNTVVHSYKIIPNSRESFQIVDFANEVNITVNGAGVAPVPVPAAVWLFGSGLLGLIGVARRETAV